MGRHHPEQSGRTKWVLVVGIVVLAGAIGTAGFLKVRHDRKVIAAAAAAAEAKRNLEEQVRQLYDLAGLDLTKLQPAEYSEAKLAEADPLKLRSLLVHLSEGRLQYWNDRLESRSSHDNLQTITDQVEGWHSSIHSLEQWRPGMTAKDLVRLKNFESRQYGQQRSLEALQKRVERLKAELAR